MFQKLKVNFFFFSIFKTKQAIGSSAWPSPFGTSSTKTRWQFWATRRHMTSRWSWRKDCATAAAAPWRNAKQPARSLWHPLRRTQRCLPQRGPSSRKALRTSVWSILYIVHSRLMTCPRWEPRKEKKNPSPTSSSVQPRQSWTTRLAYLLLDVDWSSCFLRRPWTKMFPPPTACKTTRARGFPTGEKKRTDDDGSSLSCTDRSQGRRKVEGRVYTWAIPARIAIYTTTLAHCLLRPTFDSICLILFLFFSK